MLLEICSPGLGVGGAAAWPRGRPACHTCTCTHTHTHTHTHTPLAWCTHRYISTNACYSQALEQQFTVGWHALTLAHKQNIAHAHQHSVANTTPTPVSKPTQQACKERKIGKNPLAEITSLPESGGVSQASVSSPPVSLSFSFFPPCLQLQRAQGP